MICTYTFNGGEPMPYEDLIKNLSESEIDEALSILFSLSKQESVYDSIMDLKKEYQFKTWNKSTFNHGIDGEPSIDTGDNMSIQ
jgi:hypothetical protein